MVHITHICIITFIWNIADDVPRDLFVRCKHRNVIWIMTVLRRRDAVVESTQKALLDMKTSLDKAGVTNQDAALRQAAGQDSHNASRFTLRDLRARASKQQLRAKVDVYLYGFSPLTHRFDLYDYPQCTRLSPR
jgi:type I restriction enzyme M protein